MLPQWANGHDISKKPLLQIGLGWMGRYLGAVDGVLPNALAYPRGGLTLPRSCFGYTHFIRVNYISTLSLKQILQKLLLSAIFIRSVS